MSDGIRDYGGRGDCEKQTVSQQLAAATQALESARKRLYDAEIEARRANSSQCSAKNDYEAAVKIFKEAADALLNP